MSPPDERRIGETDPPNPRDPPAAPAGEEDLVALVESLRKQNRILEKQRERSDANRIRLEEWRDKSETFHRKVISELEAKSVRLRESEARAQQASRAKSEFLANMSHEIRTPMNGVFGLTELLLQTELAPRQQQLAELIVQSSRQLLALIDDILDFSKVEAGHLTLESIPIDLRSIVEDAVWMGADAAHRKGLALICDIDDAPMVRGDPVRLRQVVVNLFGNAVKFTTEGEVSVRIHTRLDPVRGCVAVRGEVTDTGPGVPLDVQPLLFQPFTQADGSTTRRFGGTGLGLAIVRQILALMEGTTGLESEPGRGSTFWFELELPLAPAGPPAPPLPFSGRTVLVVDPHDGVAAATLRLVERLGATCLHRRSLAGPLPRADAALVSSRLPGSVEDIVAAIGIPTAVIQPFGASWAGLAETHVVLEPVRLRDLSSALESLLLRTRTPGGLLAPMPEPRKRAVHVLVAEDNAINREVVVGMLQALGAQTTAVTNGAEAVEAIRTTPFDLVLMDCQMPVLDGFEATRAIRGAEVGVAARTAIVALTANALRGDRERCLEAGMDDYLSKPFTMKELGLTLERWTAPREELAFEQSRIDELMRTDPSGRLVARLVTLVELEAGALLERLATAITDGDRAEVCGLSHALKSSVAQLGGAGLAELIRALEVDAARGVLPTPETFAAVRRGFDGFRDRLRPFGDRPDPAC